MKIESRKNAESLSRTATKKSSAEKSKKKSTSETEKSSGGRVSNRKSSKSTDIGTGSSVPDKSKPANKKSKKSEQSGLEISGTKSKNTISDKSNDRRHIDKKSTESQPEYLNLKYSSVSKKLETALIKFISENKETQHYTNLSFGSNSIIRIIDSKESEYFVNLDSEYLMINLEENSVKNYGDIFECGIDTMMNIPWSNSK